MENINKELYNVAEKYWESFLLVLPKLVLGVVVFVIAIFIAFKISQLVRKGAASRVHDQLLANFLGRLTKWVLIIAGIILTMYVVGLGGIAAGLVAGAGVSAIVIGFAFKDIAENFLAGIILAFSRPFNIGDTVQMEDIEGNVRTLDLRNTHIKTFDGKDVYIPNAKIIKTPLFNFTRDGYLRFDLLVGIDYDDDIEKARKLILDAITKIDGILDGDKAPNVYAEELATSTLNLRVYYWIDTFDKRKSGLLIKSQVIDGIKKTLIESGVLMPADIVELKVYNEKLPIPIKITNED